MGSGHTGETISDDDLAKAVDMFLDRKSMRSIAEAIGSTHPTVIAALMSERGKRMRKEAVPQKGLLRDIAWKVQAEMLDDSATPPSVRSAIVKDVLDRTDGPPTQKLETESTVKVTLAHWGPDDQGGGARQPAPAEGATDAEDD